MFLKSVMSPSKYVAHHPQVLYKRQFSFYTNNMVMDGYYVQDRLQTLWQKIDTLHLSYLQMEDSPQKLDQRAKLEECIKEYLFLAPHNQKFCFQETAQVLHRSASFKKDFSGYKASTGWNAIQMYAGNLLSQPWRREYRQINMYSGFYIHNIDANLVGAEIMFEVMGYKHVGDSVLVLDGPICPDRVANVSKDALMAYVECQILKAIWEEVSSNFPISWLDVLEFRETHFCNPKQCINALNYRFHQKQYQEQTRNNTYPQGTTTDLLARHHNSFPMIANNHSFPPLTPHIPTQCVYGTNGYNYATYAPVAAHYPCPVPLTYQQPTLKPSHYATNGYCCNNPYPAGYACPVPTGQLIELESGGYDIVDGTRQQRQHKNSLQNNDLYSHKTSNNVIVNNIESSDKEEGGFENWDYVYKNLESQGYSKDLGERGDILSALEMEKNRHRKQKATNLHEAVNNLQVADRPLKINEALEKYKENDRKKPEDVKKVVNTTPSSSYENLSHTKIKNTTKPKVAKEKTKTSKLEVKKGKTSVENAPVDGGDSGVNKWQCNHCTFLNEGCRDICEMCSKSRVIVEQKMEIGGSQCPKCTLVNPRDSTNCQACEESLKDSPTYI